MSPLRPTVRAVVALLADPDASVRTTAFDAIAEFPPRSLAKRESKALARGLTDPAVAVRRAAVLAIARVGERAILVAARELAASANDENPSVASVAWDALVSCSCALERAGLGIGKVLRERAAPAARPGRRDPGESRGGANIGSRPPPGPRGDKPPNPSIT